VSESPILYCTQRCARRKRRLGLARTRAEERAACNEQEHRSVARMPCEVPGLSLNAVWGGAMRSMPAPTRLALVVSCAEAGRWVAEPTDGRRDNMF
jgi:hypothetical protein